MLSIPKYFIIAVITNALVSIVTNSLQLFKLSKTLVVFAFVHEIMCILEHIVSMTPADDILKK